MTWDESDSRLKFYAWIRKRCEEYLPTDGAMAGLWFDFKNGSIVMIDNRKVDGNGSPMSYIISVKELR